MSSKTSPSSCLHKPVRTLSLGVGKNSCYLLFKHWKRYTCVIHCDIANGDRKHGEYDITYWILDNLVKPFCKEKNIPLVILTHKDGSLWERSQKKHMLPMMFPRWCTQDHKIALIRKYIRKELHANYPDNIVYTDIGFAYDEALRINNATKKMKYNVEEYPLVEMKITNREQIEWLNENYPLNVNGKQIDWKDAKSGCWFCPFWRKTKLLQLSDWQKQEMITLEENAKKGLGKTWKGIPLKQYLNLDSQKLDDFLEDEACTSGHCFT